MADRHKNSRRGPKGTGAPNPEKDRTEHEAARGKSQASSSLRDLSDEEFDATISEIESGSDRVAGIMCATVLQNTPCGAIISQLKDQSEVAKLFDERGPLNTFSGQIMMGRALGLYNGRVEDMLHIVRKVRNKFAHSVVSLDFKDPQIVGWCSSLKRFAEIYAPPTREMNVARRYYEAACFHFAGTILHKLNTDMDNQIRDLEAKLEIAKAITPGALSEGASLSNLLQLVSTSLSKDGD